MVFRSVSQTSKPHHHQPLAKYGALHNTPPINMPHPPTPHHHPPSNNYHRNNPTVNNQPHLNSFSRSANLPDFLLCALSLFLFITAPKHHIPLSTNRRFPRFTSTMSQTLNPKPNPNSRAFPNPQSLSDWLKPRLPSDSFAAWGTKPGTKNVHNLWLELSDGETALVDRIPPIRNLEVVCVRVLGNHHDYDKKVLIGSHQELSDGSIRKRDRFLSEKLKAGEDIDAAVKRAIREELGSVILRGDNNDGKDVNFDENVKVVMDSYERNVEERDSVSYPGLPSCYVLHTVDAFVQGLPEGEFVTEEGTEYEGCNDGVVEEAISVKKHFWRWVPADSM